MFRLALTGSTTVCGRWLPCEMLRVAVRSLRLSLPPAQVRYCDAQRRAETRAIRNVDCVSREVDGDATCKRRRAKRTNHPQPAFLAWLRGKARNAVSRPVPSSP